MSWVTFRSPKHPYRQGRFFPLRIVSHISVVLPQVQKKKNVKRWGYGMVLICIKRQSLEFRILLVPEGLSTAIETIMMT